MLQCTAYMTYLIGIRGGRRGIIGCLWLTLSVVIRRSRHAAASARTERGVGGLAKGPGADFMYLGTRFLQLSLVQRRTGGMLLEN